MKFCAFDTETTGLDPRFNEAIEYGIVMLNPETFCPIHDSLEVKLRIEYPERVTPGTLGIHNHWDVAVWAQQAVSQAEGWQRLCDWLFQHSDGGADRITLVGQNIVAFDQPLLEASCARFALKPQISYHPEDLMASYASLKRRLKMKLGKCSLKAIAEFFEISNPNAHGALADAMTTGLCYALCEAYQDALIDCGRTPFCQLIEEAWQRIGCQRPGTHPLPPR